MILSAFTEKYSTIQKKLISSVIIESAEPGKAVKPVIASAQWDTGATGTCISKEVVKYLKLAPIGMVSVNTPSGAGVMNKYKINLILNNEVKISDLSVMDSEIGNQGIDVLIGMDIISLGDFAVSNFEKKTQFSFRVPSQQHIEFSK
ncbi:MAG: aspartyl protease family protein [Clostridiales bacterium]|nr:aspartyl protease family protein [Clostridiales bacterium]MCD7882276.1 aspartyl protease family protein [Lachnospiraceae bacterium]